MPVINESLNIVIPIGGIEKNQGLYAYHSPISTQFFERYYRVLAATKAALSQKGILYLMDAGPRIASLALKEECTKDAEENNKGGSNDAASILAEIRRLTTILVTDEMGCHPTPVDQAIKQGVLDPDLWSETESALVFFTFHYSLSWIAERSRICTATALVLKGSITSLPPMEWFASLPISMPEDATETKAASSVPC